MEMLLEFEMMKIVVKLKTYPPQVEIVKIAMRCRQLEHQQEWVTNNGPKLVLNMKKKKRRIKIRTKRKKIRIGKKEMKASVCRYNIFGYILSCYF